MNIRKVKIKHFKLLLILTIFIILLVISLPKKDLVLESEWFECEQHRCKYKVTIKNTSSQNVYGYLRVNGEVRSSNAYKSQAVVTFYSEKLYVTLESGKNREFSGTIESPVNSDQYLTFHIQTLE